MEVWGPFYSYSCALGDRCKKKDRTRETVSTKAP